MDEEVTVKLNEEVTIYSIAIKFTGVVVWMCMCCCGQMVYIHRTGCVETERSRIRGALFACFVACQVVCVIILQASTHCFLSFIYSVASSAFGNYQVLHISMVHNCLF